MNAAEVLLAETQELVLLDPNNVSRLIGKGLELRLPMELKAERIEGITTLDMVNVGVVAGEVQVTKGTDLFDDEDVGWTFSRIGPYPLIVTVNDWWPVFVFLRLEALIKEIPTRYVDLGPLLGQALELGKALGLPEQLVGEPFHPNADAPIPRTVTMTPVELLQVACSSRHELGDTWKHERGFYLTICEQGDNIKYELRVLNLPPLLKAVVEALDKRAKNLEIAWPA